MLQPTISRFFAFKSYPLYPGAAQLFITLRGAALSDQGLAARFARGGHASSIRTVLLGVSPPTKFTISHALTRSIAA